MWPVSVFPTCLFLSCLSVELAPSRGSSTDENDSYPPFWDQINGDIREFPVKDNKTVINVWSYLDRLKMYKVLIKESNKYFVQFGQNNTGNVLWALTLFYGKLYETSRFSDPSSPSVCAYEAEYPGCIAINSGWGGINFYVITMNFLGAIESGFLKDALHEIALLAPQEHRSDFCYSIEECRVFYPQAMDAARRFYEYLLSRKVSSLVDDVPVYDTDEDTVITYMWEAHQVAIDVATPKFSDISQYSSKTERDFTKDFLVAIEFCEAAKYRPYFKSAAEFLVGYPHRLLTDQDILFVAKDFSLREQAHLSTVKLISATNTITGGLFLTMWMMAMNVSKLNQLLAPFFINRLLLIPIL